MPRVTCRPRKGTGACKTHCKTAPQNRATSDATGALRAKRNTSSSSQVTDTGFVAFISCSKPQHLGFGLFFFSPSDKLLKFADTEFCVALQQLTQQWCSDHQISREVFLSGCILSSSLFFLSCINHSVRTGGFSFNKPIIEKINTLQRKNLQKTKHLFMKRQKFNNCKKICSCLLDLLLSEELSCFLF